jgi:hypothetical protein
MAREHKGTRPPLFETEEWIFLVLFVIAATIAVFALHRNAVWVGIKLVVMGGIPLVIAFRTRRALIRRREDQIALAEARARRSERPGQTS